jgi:hypothetical protein
MVIGLDNTILNVALPSLIKDLNASTSQLQWIIDGYVLVFAGLLLTSGSLGDRFGRRGALTIGLTIFGVGSLFCSMATSANALIFTRAFMGIGAADHAGHALAAHQRLHRAQGEGSGHRHLGRRRRRRQRARPDPRRLPAAALLVGSVFLINIPVVILAMCSGRFLLPTSKDPSAAARSGRRRALGHRTVALLWGSSRPRRRAGPTRRWSAASSSGSIVLGRSSLGAAIDHPMLDIRFFKNPASPWPTRR